MVQSVSSFILVVGAIFHTSQCTHVSTGAFGSSTINTRLRVAVGILSRVRGGEIFGPSEVYFTGILPILLKAGLFNLISCTALAAVVTNKN